MNKVITNQSSPNLIGQASPEFDLNSFEAALWSKGYSVTVEQAFKCPCRTNSNQPLTDCKNCLGTGWIFVNPVKTKALITSINKDTKYKSWSEELIGTVSASLMYKDGISFMNRITLVNNSKIENKSKYSDTVRIRDIDADPFVFLAYKPIDVLSVYAFNGSDKALVKIPEGSYSISPTNDYVLDIDYDFSSMPDFNGYLTVLYSHELQYHVIDIPHDVRNSYIKNEDGQEEQINLPVNAYARKAQNVFDISNRDGSGVIDNSDNKTVITADNITITSDSVNVDASGGSI